MAQCCYQIRTQQKPSFNSKDHLKLLLFQMGNNELNKQNLVSQMTKIFTGNAIHLITRIIWIQDSFFQKIHFIVVHITFYLISSVVYSDQLFGAALYILNILTRYYPGRGKWVKIPLLPGNQPRNP